MVRNLKVFVLAGALVAVSSPVFATEMMSTPLGDMDMDPLNIMSAADAPAAPAAAPMMKHHHHMMHHHMMMKHHTMKKKM